MRRSPRVEQAEALLLHMHVHVHVVTASITLCRKYRVAASITYSCSLYHIGLQVATSRERRERSSLPLVCGCHTNVLGAADTPG